jgi:multidrug resistance efflux pump
LRTALAQREKCVIRAPISGTITRVNMRAGQAFSTVMPHPIVTMADLTEQRIRAEVDERDLSRIMVNQRVRIQVEGYQKPLAGRVIWTSVVMGRKTARSTDPADKSDRDILETLIAPERSAVRLPIGLRVLVEFLAN